MSITFLDNRRVIDMPDNVRKTGIGQVGDVPWGTHFCQFYETKQDLADLLIPYFKSGLENNEFCIWVTSHPLECAEAEELLRASIKNLDAYLKRGQLEILDYSEWYTKGGGFDSKRVLDGWVDKLDKALGKGFEGLRLSGNTFWIEKSEWSHFVDYEEAVESVISGYRMLAICTYSLERCNASEVIDVVSNHQFALIKRQGKWVKIETSDAKRASSQVQHLASFPELNPNPVAELDLLGRTVYINPVAHALWQEYIDERGGKLLAETWMETLAALRQEKSNVFMREFVVGNAIYHLTLCYLPEQKVLRVYGVDITARQLVLRERENQLRVLSEQVPIIIWVADSDLVITSYAGSAMKAIGITPEAMIGEHITSPVLGLNDRGRKIVLDACRRALNGETIRYDLNLRGRFWESNVSPFHNEASEIIGVIGVAYDSTEIYERDKEIEQGKQKLNDLSARLLQAQEMERKRLAGDIHDSIGQYLAAIGMRAQGVVNLIEAGGLEDAAKSLKSLLPLIQQSVKEVRRIQADLRPAILDDMGIVATINWYVKEFKTTYPGIKLHKRISVLEDDVPDFIKPIVFRILQESLSNASKHSGADSVAVSLSHNRDRIALKISDNGHGFDPDDVHHDEGSMSSGLGLKSMQERAQLSGGAFGVRSQAGKGTIIEVTWPIQ
jgi:PAS domain S-box-containing protein